MFNWVTISIPIPSVDLVTLLLVNWGVGVVILGVFAIVWMIENSGVKGAKITIREMGKVFGFIAPFGLLLIVTVLLIRVLRLNK